jgi:hypothetical protein
MSTIAVRSPKETSPKPFDRAVLHLVNTSINHNESNLLQLFHGSSTRLFRFSTFFCALDPNRRSPLNIVQRSCVIHIRSRPAIVTSTGDCKSKVVLQTRIPPNFIPAGRRAQVRSILELRFCESENHPSVNRRRSSPVTTAAAAVLRAATKGRPTRRCCPCRVVDPQAPRRNTSPSPP